MSYSGTVRCGHCWEKGHNRRSCPSLRKVMIARLEDDPEDLYAKYYFKEGQKGKKKSCGYCGTKGHTRRTCKELDYAKAITKRVCGEWRKKLVDSLKVAGVGVGALVKYTRWGDEKLGVVSEVLWDKLDHRINFGYSGDAAALIATPVEDFSGNNTMRLYIPVTREVFSDVGFEYYLERTPNVVSPIAENLVSQQVPKDYFSGQSCLNDIFKEDEKSQDRPTSSCATPWCELQGFYVDSSED